MRLSRQIVNFVGPGLADYSAKSGRIAKVAVVQLQAFGARVKAFAKMVYPTGRKARSAAHDAVNFVALAQKKFSEVGAILSGDSGYQSAFSHRRFGSTCFGQHPATILIFG
jgi:hypothetical protein